MARGRPEIERERCTGCGECLPVCPQKILALSEGTKRKRRRVCACVDEEICIACGECAKACPKCAIRIWSYSIAAGG